MKELLILFQEIRNKIFEQFGLEVQYEDLDIRLNDIWIATEDFVAYQSEKTLPEMKNGYLEFTYGADIYNKSRYETDECIMFLIDNGLNTNTYYYVIFDKLKQYEI